jgi:2-hydroxy-3-keto-5-methylthiopentenyl-1-phosphate phosphatase
VSKVVVLCDFDGTVASEDVGNMFFRTFGGDEAQAIVEEWKQGRISSRTCFEREAALVTATRTDVERFIDKRRLDPYFKDFTDFAGKNGIEVVIVSDGLDYYIERMLMRSGLGMIDFSSNVMELVDGTLRLRFPHYDMKDCRDCGNCKTYHLEKYKSQGHTIVYVGNGLSDRCPSTYADLVFAKGELLDFCRENNLNYVAFENFRDVEREILSRFVLALD